MRSDSDLELVRELHPEDDGAWLEAQHQARVVLLAEIARAGITSRQRRVRARARLPLLPSVGVLGAVAIAAAAIVVSSALNGGAARPGAAAAAVLQRAARAAEASGGPRQLRPGEYWYVHSRETVTGVVVAGKDGGPGGAHQIVDARGATDRQAWIGANRPGRVVERVVGPITFLSSAARRQWERAGRPAQLNPRSFSLPPDAFDMPDKDLLALPTNVDALWKVVKHRAGTGSAAWQRHEMFTVIGDLLREDPLPAAARAALYRVAARIPEIQVLGLTHDGIGRPALAVALNDTMYGSRDELLFDPHTYKLLGESTIIEKPNPKFHVKRGTVTYESTYLASGIAGRVGQRPHY